MSLEELNSKRDSIDHIDSEIVALLDDSNWRVLSSH